MYCLSPAPVFLRRRGDWIVYDGRHGTVVASDLTAVQGHALIADLTEAPDRVEERSRYTFEQIREATAHILAELGTRAMPSDVCAALCGMGPHEAAATLQMAMDRHAAHGLSSEKHQKRTAKTCPRRRIGKPRYGKRNDQILFRYRSS